MKNTILITLFLCLCIAIQAQIHPAKKTPKLQGKQMKGNDLSLNLFEKRCSDHYQGLKEFVRIVLHLDGQTLNTSISMPQTQIIWDKGNQTQLLFFSNHASEDFPLINYNLFQNPPGYAGPVMEGYLKYDIRHNQSAIYGITYEQGNYQDVVSVEKLYRQGNDTYARITRNNGLSEDIIVKIEFKFPYNCKIN